MQRREFIRKFSLGSGAAAAAGTAVLAAQPDASTKTESAESEKIRKHSAMLKDMKDKLSQLERSHKLSQRSAIAAVALLVGIDISLLL